MIRRDLKAAGVLYKDAAGRVADFHALRHSYVSALARSTAPVKIVQSLARHSTPTLTLNTYAHVGLHDHAAALAALPDLSPPTDRPETAKLAATGRYGPINEQQWVAHGQRAGTETVASRRTLAEWNIPASFHRSVLTRCPRRNLTRRDGR
jgi:hypothetical protein